MTLTVNVLPNGDRQVGEKFGSTFVPYLTVPLWRIEQLTGPLDKGKPAPTTSKPKGGA